MELGIASRGFVRPAGTPEALDNNQIRGSRSSMSVTGC
jgi:hypothetical protein